MTRDGSSAYDKYADAIIADFTLDDQLKREHLAQWLGQFGCPFSIQVRNEYCKPHQSLVIENCTAIKTDDGFEIELSAEDAVRLAEFLERE